MTTRAKARPAASSSKTMKKSASAKAGKAAKSTGKPATKAAPSSEAPNEDGDDGDAVAAAPKPTRVVDDLPAVTDAESLEMLKAIDAYKRRTGKHFPTWTEVLQIMKALGYRKGA